MRPTLYASWWLPCLASMAASTKRSFFFALRLTLQSASVAQNAALGRCLPAILATAVETSARARFTR